MKKTITILCSVIFMLLIVAAIINISNFSTQEKYELSTPRKSEVTQIIISKDDKDKVVEDETEFKIVLSNLSDFTRTTGLDSIQDYPVNADGVVQIKCRTKDDKEYDYYIYSRKKLGLFGKKAKYYLEQPYNGIYDINKEVYQILDNLISNEPLPQELTMIMGVSERSFYYNDRLYELFGVQDKKMKDDDIGEAIGYLVRNKDELHYTGSKLYTLSDTQDFIMEKDDDEFMSIRCFYRAYDTKDKVIEIPEYIYDQEYDWWK